MLASRLKIPEYRLRRLINQRLSPRNFASFVNSYRLAETMLALGGGIDRIVEKSCTTRGPAVTEAVVARYGPLRG
jgi:hypothetical protein